MRFDLSKPKPIPQKMNIGIRNGQGFPATPNNGYHARHLKHRYARARANSGENVPGEKRQFQRSLRSIFPLAWCPVKREKIFNLPQTKMFLDPFFVSRCGKNCKPAFALKIL